MLEAYAALPKQPAAACPPTLQPTSKWYCATKRAAAAARSSLLRGWFRTTGRRSGVKRALLMGHSSCSGGVGWCGVAGGGVGWQQLAATTSGQAGWQQLSRHQNRC